MQHWLAQSGRTTMKPQSHEGVPVVQISRKRRLIAGRRTNLKIPVIFLAAQARRAASIAAISILVRSFSQTGLPG